ncbi:MAG TPA: MlaD family protein [Methylocystis sp.]|nr:MlaD family protein [Methylocystis sp.]
METRASFAAIGALALAVALGAFAFIYWVAGPSKTAELKTYQVIVRGSVDGLTRGSAVQFNGLKVGEVKSLRIDEKDPSLVDLLISIDKTTPVKTDTRARLEQRLLTGVAIVSLVGATSDAPPLVAKPNERYPRIAAEPSEMRSLMENVQRLSTRAGDVLDKLDKLIDENAGSLTASIKNVETFSKTLADNSEPTASLLKDSAAFMHTLKPVAEKFDHLISSADKTIKALDPKTMKSIADNMAGLSENINRFTQTGLPQYQQLAIDARHAVETLNKAVHNFDRDPSQVIFGPSSSLPEVKGH